MKPRLGINDLEVVEGCENVAEKLKLTVPSYRESGAGDGHDRGRDGGEFGILPEAQEVQVQEQDRSEK